MLRLNSQEFATHFFQHFVYLPPHSLFVYSRFPRPRRLIVELSDLVVAPPLMKTCSTRCAAHELLVVQTFARQFIQRKFQTSLVQIAPHLRNAALAWRRAGLASFGATAKRQATQGPSDALSPVDAFLRHCLSLSAKCSSARRDTWQPGAESEFSVISLATPSGDLSR